MFLVSAASMFLENFVVQYVEISLAIARHSTALHIQRKVEATVQLQQKDSQIQCKVQSQLLDRKKLHKLCQALDLITLLNR